MKNCLVGSCREGKKNPIVNTEGELKVAKVCDCTENPKAQNEIAI